MITDRLLWEIVDYADQQEQAKLDLLPRDQVRRIARTVLSNRGVLMYERIAHPLKRLRILGALDITTLAVPLGRASETMRRVPVAPVIAGALGIAAGTLVVELDRVVLSKSREPIEWRVAYIGARNSP